MLKRLNAENLESQSQKKSKVKTQEAKGNSPIEKEEQDQENLAGCFNGSNACVASKISTVF
jgi:hypothetical protein